MEAMGMCRVVIEDGKVIEVTAPEVSYCPLFYRHRGLESIDIDAVRKNIEFRIADFGMCTPDRVMSMDYFLSFGISEITAMAVEMGELDCGVLVCDGTGTVVVDRPDMVQGIGGRISGIVETSPIPEVIAAVGEDHVLDPESAAIDQVEGVALAQRLGYKRIAVTVALEKDALAIRERFGPDPLIFAVHTSGRTLSEAETFFDVADIVTACASRTIREVGRRRALLQVGSGVPVYAASERGQRLMLLRLEQIGKSPTTGEEDPPHPLL